MSTLDARNDESVGVENARNTAVTWLDGAFVEPEKAVISVFDHGLLYGDGCFEGIRAYNGRIFKLGAHLDRMWTSASELRLDPPFSRDEIESAIRESMERLGRKDAYIRLVFTRGVGTLGLHPFHCPKSTAFIITDSITLYPKEMYDEGMEIIVAHRRRVPVCCLDPRVKSLNYLNNIMAKVEAIDAGVLEALMLNMDGEVSECTGDNIFIVKDGVISTPPVSAGILVGVTRQYIINTIAPSCGFEVQERPIQLDDVFGADELFLTGTAAEIIGVRRVGDRTIGSGSVGDVTRRLSTAFSEIVSENAPED
jgi:branched-chain amino acid aminotransferase